MCKNCQLKPVYEFTNKRKLCRICFVRWFEKKFLTTIRKFKMIENGDCIVYFKTDLLCFVVLEELLKLLEAKAPISIKGVKLPTNTPRVYPEKSFSKIFTKGKKLDKIAVPSTIDLEADKIIHTLIKGKASQLKKISPVNEKVIKPLYLFLDEEVLLYAKLKKLKFKKVKETPQAYTASLCSQCKNLSRGPEYQRHDSSKDDSGEPSTEPKSSVKIFTRGKDKISEFIDELEKKHPEVKRAVVRGVFGNI